MKNMAYKRLKNNYDRCKAYLTNINYKSKQIMQDIQNPNNNPNLDELSIKLAKIMDELDSAHHLVGKY